MKLKQRLAAVLAVATITAAVPMVTHAGPSENFVNREVTVAKDTVFSTTSSAVYLVVDAPYIENGSVFYLTLENAKWADGKNTTFDIPGVKVTCYDDKEAAVEVTDVDLIDRLQIRIPMLTKVTGGDAYVHIDSGSGSVTSEKVKFATVISGDELMKVKVGDPKSFYDEGVIADIDFSEIMANTTAGKSVAERTILIELDHSDFEFDLPSNGKIELKLGRGFLVGGASSTIEVDAEYEGRDCQSISFVIPEMATSSRGEFSIKGLEIISNTKDPDLGAVDVDISGHLVGDVRNLEVAIIAEYGSKLESKDVDIAAGRTEDITFTLSEIVPDSMVSGRYVDFEFNMGYIAEATGDKEDDLAILEDHMKALKSGDDNLAFDDVIVDVITDEIDDVEYITGFAFVVPEKIEDFKFEMPLTMPLDADGDVIVTATGRGIDNVDLEAVVAVATPTIKTEIKPMTLKVGLADQVGGSITITETADGVMERGEDIVLILESDSGMRFEEVPNIEVTAGDLELDIDEADISSIKLANGDRANALIIPVARASKEASTITISDFEITVDRSVPEGKYDLSIGGSALTESTSLTVKDFIVIGTKNTEDLNGEGDVKVVETVSTFKVGSTVYNVDGTAYPMDAAPYVTTKARTMVPVRYLAVALGISEQQIYFADGIVTLFYNDDIVQMKEGNNAIILNGIAIPTDEAVVIKENRTYAPIGELARILGIDVKWDNTTQTATFTAEKEVKAEPKAAAPAVDTAH